MRRNFCFSIVALCMCLTAGQSEFSAPTLEYEQQGSKPTECPIVVTVETPPSEPEQRIDSFEGSVVITVEIPVQFHGVACGMPEKPGEPMRLEFYTPKPTKP